MGYRVVAIKQITKLGQGSRTKLNNFPPVSAVEVVVESRALSVVRLEPYVGGAGGDASFERMVGYSRDALMDVGLDLCFEWN